MYKVDVQVYSKEEGHLGVKVFQVQGNVALQEPADGPYHP